MYSYKKHLVSYKKTVGDALVELNKLAQDAILFVVDDESRLVGSVTDGDVRRGLIKGILLEDTITRIIQPDPHFLRISDHSLEKIIEYRDNNFRIIPILSEEGTIIDIINFRERRSYLPIEAIIMAGGRGQRLSPLTDTIPKPLLPIADKPIIEHNIDRLYSYGVNKFWISVNYLAEKIEEYFKNGSQKNIHISYLFEDKPLGTIGAVSKIQDFKHQYVLIMNSDVLTNIDYEHFLLQAIKSDADVAIASIPYNVNIPYAVLQSENGRVITFEEKPTYTYYSNGGIYLVKTEYLKTIPKDVFFNATDFIEVMIQNKKTVISYPLAGYWLDIGNPADYQKAQSDFFNIKF